MLALINTSSVFSDESSPFIGSSFNLTPRAGFSRETSIAYDDRDEIYGGEMDIPQISRKNNTKYSPFEVVDSHRSAQKRNKKKVRFSTPHEDQLQ